MNKTIRSNCMLLLTALIWGGAFVAQSAGMEFVGPYTFNGVRSLLGALVLIPVILLMDRLGKKDRSAPKNTKKLIVGGICCGVFLFIGSTLQQLGIQYTTAGKAGFITALYIIIVPILGIFLKRKASFLVWISVAVALGGMYLLCIQEDFSVNTGDILVMLCAVGFSLHILVIDHFSPHVDGVRMSCIQFFVCGVLSCALMFIFEQPSFSAIGGAWLSIAYAGVMSCGVAYTLQIIAQKDTNPVVASLLLSLESVFAVLAGWLILGESLSTKEFIGCALVFVAVILAQIPVKSVGSKPGPEDAA